MPIMILTVIAHAMMIGHIMPITMQVNMEIKIPIIMIATMIPMEMLLMRPVLNYATNIHNTAMAMILVFLPQQHALEMRIV